MLWVGTRQGGDVRGQSVCVFACVTCKMWVRWVLVWGTNWNERRCASLSQHGRSICQGDITALTPHPSPPDATEPCSSWWLISIPPSLHCIPLPPLSTHTLPLLHTCTPTNKQILMHTVLYSALLFTYTHSGCALSAMALPFTLSYTHGWRPGPPASHRHKLPNCSKLFLFFGGTGLSIDFIDSGSTFWF